MFLIYPVYKLSTTTNRNKKTASKHKTYLSGEFTVYKQYTNIYSLQTNDQYSRKLKNLAINPESNF